MKRNSPQSEPDARGEDEELMDLEADHELVGLINDLHAIFAAVHPPADLARPPLEPLQLVGSRRGATAQRARWSDVGRLTRFIPGPLGRAVAAAVLVALLLSGVAFAGETLLNRVFRMDPGTQQILQDDQYQAINVSHSFGGATLTVERAYADANRIIVGYTLQLAGGTTPDPKVAVSLRTSDGTVLPIRGGAGYSDRATSNDVTSFDAANISGTPSEVTVRLEARAQAGPQAGETWGVDLTLPFHPGRVAQPNQSLTVNGGTVTLKKVVLTPSELRIYLAGVGEFFIAHLSTGNVFDGWDSDSGRDSVGPISQWTTAEGLSAVSYFAALYQRHGEWTLQVGLAGGVEVQPAYSTPTPMPMGGPWTFHFVIP